MKNIFKNCQLLQGASAFTLAETLITLGIIGIVAAITVPTLMKNYQQYTWNTSAQLFERRLEEALKIMNSQNDLSNHSTTEDFVYKLKNYMKITKICDNNNLSDCFNPKIELQILNFDDNDINKKEIVNVDDLSSSQNLNQNKNWSTNTMGIQFTNGTNAIIAFNNYNCKSNQFSNQINGLDCISMIYDTSGIAKPNILGKDIRSINSKFDGELKLNEKYWTKPQKVTSPLTKKECENLKNELGINGCYEDNDYWAAAVNMCGGKNNLPSRSDMLQLAKALYLGYDSMHTKPDGGSTVYCADDKECLDVDKVKSLGLNISGGYIWANQELSYNNYDNYAHDMAIYKNSYQYQGYTFTRKSTAPMVMCVKN